MAKRLKFCAALLFLTLMTSLASAQEVRGIEIVEYGLYAVDKTDCKRDAQGIERCDRNNIRHAATTWTVPANIGVEFGLRYRIVGRPRNAKISIRRVWLLPGGGFQPPSGKSIDHIDRVDTVEIGQSTLMSYGFDDAWELVPGPWVVKFFYNDRELGQRTFTVVK